MGVNKIYQKAFMDELEKFGFRLPRPAAIRKSISFGKKLKQRFDEKYGLNKKKKKKSKRKKHSSFIFFRK